MKDYYKYVCPYCGHNWESYLSPDDGVECDSCGNLSSVRSFKIPEPEAKDMIDIWVKIGRSNPWIAGAYDPSFGRDSFCECKTVGELKENFEHGNWCLGQAFYYKNLCFINQVNGGDEWLTIKDNISFESISMRRGFIMPREYDDPIPSGAFEDLISRLENATLEQCRSLNY